MSILFIDSTYNLTLGILNDELKWLAFETHQGQKASAIIQDRVHQLLNVHETHPTSLKAIITANGPGFYTGLRLSEGFADVFKFFGVPTYSFYTYEIPAWCGFTNGLWFTKAYRGEYFLYFWNERTNRRELLSASEIESTLNRENQVFIHSDVSLDALSSSLISMPKTTLSLLETYPDKIFRQVMTNHFSRESFYFRPPEDEFKANP